LALVARLFLWVAGDYWSRQTTVFIHESSRPLVGVCSLSANGYLATSAFSTFSPVDDRNGRATEASAVQPARASSTGHASDGGGEGRRAQARHRRVLLDDGCC